MMPSTTRAEQFVRRQIFYIGVIIFDLFALVMFMMAPGSVTKVEPPPIPRHLEDLSRLFSSTYLEWVKRTQPVLFAALAILLFCLLVLAGVGIVLLFRAGVRIVHGRKALSQQLLVEARWNLWDVIKIAATYPFFILLGYSVVSIVVPLKGLSREGVLLLGLVVNYFAMLMALFLIWHVVRVEHGQSLVALGYTLPRGRIDLFRAVGCYAAFLPMFFLASQCTQMVAMRFGFKPRMQEIIPIFISEESLAITVALVLLACILAPIVEETFFRGFLQSVMRKLIGPDLAIFVTALLFALSHRSLSVFLPILVLGLVLGYLYERTQSTFAAAFLHGLHNTMTTVFLIIIKYMPAQEGYYMGG